MKKLSFLAALIIASSTVYGVNYSANPSTNTNSNTNAKQNQSTERTNETSRFLAAADERYASGDQKLAKDIHDKLSSGIFSKGYEQVAVDVRDGAVTLTGTVPTQADKDKVEKEVRNISGVRSLTSKIAIADKSTAMNTATTKSTQDSYASPADQQLNMKIRDKITGWFWDSYPDVSLDTSSGIVVLEGFVETPKDQQNLMLELRKIEGVKSVKSNLKVKNANQ